MKFGVSISSMVQVPKGQDMQQRITEIITYLHEASRLGYEYVSLGQHYLAEPYQMFQPIPLYARLAPETGSMRLHTTILLPLQHPVELAEQMATLDVITGGRMTMGIAIGYRQEEYDAFGVNPKQRVGRTLECLEVVRRLWTEDSVTFHGKHFHFDNVNLVTKPVQKPHPPIWVAANADAAIERAARLGLAWHINPHADYATVSRQVVLYREAARKAGQTGNLDLPMNREVYCAETTEQAFAEGQPYLGAKYLAYAQWGQDKALPGDEDFRKEFGDLQKGRFIVGSPDDCVAQLKPFCDLGVSVINFRMSWAGMPLELSLKSLRVVAEKVIPRLR